MFKHVTYIMVNVSDMSRSVAFYRDKLGMTLKYQTDYWTEFETGTTILALHLADRPARDGKKSNSAAVAGTCSIGFSVDDIEQTYTQLQAKGVTFVTPPMTQEAEGIKLTVCVDPDGLPISLAEALQN